LSGRLRGALGRIDEVEVFSGNRIGVFLAKEMLVNQNVDRGGKHAGAGFALEQENGPAYWRPRKTHSSSRSRCAMWCQTGMTAVIKTAMTLSATSSAAIAYPC
jgi:hypothetical protein